MDALSELLADLRRTKLRDLAGTSVAARVPVSRALINRLVREALQGQTTVREVEVRPLAGDRFEAVVALAWRLVPPFTVAFEIDQQPEFPASPVLILRWSLLGGLGAIASRFIASLDRLPPGITLLDDRLVIDLPVVVAGGPAAELMPFVKGMQIHSEADRMVLHLDLEVGS